MELLGHSTETKIVAVIVARVLSTVEPDQFADAILEMVPMGLSPEFHLLRRKIHASCGDLVQQRLPEVGPRLVNQCNIDDAALTQRVAKPCDQLQTSSAAADDNDPMYSALAAFRTDCAG